MDKLKIGLCIPTYGTIHSNFLVNVIRMISEYSDRYYFEFFVVSSMFIDHVRNNIVKDALGKDLNYLWFIDSDNMVPPGALDKMVGTMEREGADLVSALYFKKIRPYPPVLLERKSDGHFYHLDNVPMDSVVRIGACGFGCVLINPRVFEKIKFPYFWATYELNGGKYSHIGEDVYFCRQLDDAGFKMVADTSVVCTHLGGDIGSIESEGFRKIRQDNSDERESFIQHASEFLKISPETVRRNICEGPDLIKNEWNQANPMTEKEINSFYKNTINYLYDLAHWHYGNRRYYDLQLVKSIKNLKPKKVLDYGAGAGFNSILLANEFDVTLADLDSKTLDFAEFRFKQLNLPGKFWRIDKEPKPKEKYDVILCFDVLEHLSKDEVLKAIETLSSLKSDRCQIFITTSFGKSSIHPMHFNSDEDVEKAIKNLMEGQK